VRECVNRRAAMRYYGELSLAAVGQDKLVF
jgi:hypothetical protein